MPGSASSYIKSLTAVGGTLFFVANDGTTGWELWRSDGTEAGTTLIKDIWPGDSGSYPFGTSPELLTAVGGTLYFTADDGANGRELWKSDGTEAGTLLVEDIRPGAATSSPAALTAADGLLLLVADDGVHGTEVWRSDGTPVGTALLKDVNNISNGSLAADYVEFKGEVYFTADDGIHGRWLYKTDGTAAGTVVFKGIEAGLLTVVGDQLFFLASDPEHGTELWRSDGTASGTALVKDIWPGPGSPGILQFTVMDGLLFFAAWHPTYGNELWRSDGTEAGTVMVKDIQPGDQPGSYNSFPSDLTVVDGTLFFAAVNDEFGNELWRTDGTEAGTFVVKDIGHSSPIPTGF